MLSVKCVKPTESGFTLIELLISSVLGLVIATFCLQSLHDFISAEQFVDSRFRSVQSNSQVIEIVSLMTEMSGFLPSDSLSFTSSWNYGAGQNNFATGEIIKINNDDKESVMSLRLMGDSYREFRDCHGKAFGMNTVVYISFSLNNGHFACRARHYTGDVLQSDTTKNIVDNIQDVRVTAIFRSDSLKWKASEKSNTIEKPTYIKAILLEVLSESDQPAYTTAIQQKFQLFDGSASFTSKNAIVYQSKLLALTNQEHQSEY